MSEPRSTYYVTTPIYYVNDRPHLGHVYTTTIADIVARFHRVMGDDTFFLTGTDEHAAKVSDRAAEMGLSPLECADRHSAAYSELFTRLKMTHDDFIRTTEERHKSKVTRYITALLDSATSTPANTRAGTTAEPRSTSPRTAPARTTTSRRWGASRSSASASGTTSFV
jgi:methionyl-tRNA synthetase